MLDRSIRLLQQILSVLLCLFVLAEVNYPQIQPQSQLAIFAGLGLVLCFLRFPLHARFAASLPSKVLDLVLSLATLAVTGFIVVQTEPGFEDWWLGGSSLGDRAGVELPMDFAVGFAGLLLVLEGARRAVGPALPILSSAFIAYGFWGPSMPGWLFPHRGYGLERIVGQTFLHSQGVYGIALKVMFTYVFLFVIFGAFLELTGATRFVIETSQRLLGNTPGGPAKVSILSSGLMGSLSGSAVANTATTGTFTIPLMRSSGFKPHIAAGIEAAASSGGALVPPVMGAGAYMMLEIVEPQVTYLQIVQAALLPAILYYLSLFLIAHYSAHKLAAAPTPDDSDEATEPSVSDQQAKIDLQNKADSVPAGAPEGLVFGASLGSLILFLLLGFTVFRSVSLAIVVTLLCSALHSRTRLAPAKILRGLTKGAAGGIALVAAAASVGIVLGIVTLTGIGSKLPAAIIPLAEQNLLLALLLIMTSSIVLGMGLPSAVCYLLLATLIGPAIGDLGVVPLAAHLFIFYFGLMSMVTPPVALAAYTAASIAGSKIMRTAMASFRFALVGFVLPFLFVYRPELLMLNEKGESASWLAILLAFGLTALAMVPLSSSIAGFFAQPLTMAHRALLIVITLLLIFPGDGPLNLALPISVINLAGVGALLVFWRLHRRRDPQVTAHPL